MRRHLALPYLLLVPLAVAQGPSITFSIAGSSCVIIGQMTANASPNTLERATPLCPGETRDISWPLSNGGMGDNSYFGLYADIQDGKPSCIVGLNAQQVGYLKGRQLQWREKDNLLYDVAAGAELLNTQTWEPIAW